MAKASRQFRELPGKPVTVPQPPALVLCVCGHPETVHRLEGTGACDHTRFDKQTRSHYDHCRCRVFVPR